MKYRHVTHKRLTGTRFVSARGDSSGGSRKLDAVNILNRILKLFKLL